jgi:hypothetical protein
VPIVNFVGLLDGVNVHKPDFDQDLTPEEFVETTADKLITWRGANEETFHVTVVEGAATAEPPPVNPAKTPARNRTPIVRRERGINCEKIFIGRLYYPY